MVKRILGLIMAVGLIAAWAGTAWAGWLSGWDKRIEGTIDSSGAKVDSDLTYFPLLLYLSSSSGTGSTDVTAVFDEVGANSKKIAVTKNDGTTQLYVEIEKWDSSGEEAWLWVSKSDWTISSSADTTVYIYYDNDQSDNTSYVGDSGSRTEVWDSHAKMVQHLEETSRTAGSYNDHIDSTSNDNDGEAEITPESNMNGAGKINGADVFDGDNDYVNCYDEKTQALTRSPQSIVDSPQTTLRLRSGQETEWKYFKDLSVDDEILTLNPETGKSEWHKPYRFIEYPYKGKMLHILAKGEEFGVRSSESGVDLLVTPDHQMFASLKIKNTNQKFKKNKTDENNQWGDFQLLIAEEIYGKEIQLLTPDSELPTDISPSEMEWVDYDGTVYDVTVENHILLVRRGVGQNNYGKSGARFPYITNNASAGFKTLTLSCALSSLSPENIGQESFNANDKYGESLKFNSIASGILSENSEKEASTISFLMNENASDSSSFVNLVRDNNLSTFLPISNSKNSGAINSKTPKTLLASNTSNGFPFLTNAENTTFASTTNNIFHLPLDNFSYLLANDKLTSSASSLACSSVNLDFSTILLILANSSNSSFSRFSMANCQFILDTFLNSSNSSGILTTNSAISTTSGCNHSIMKENVNVLMDDEKLSPTR